MTTLWKYGRSLPKRMSFRSNADFALASSPAVPHESKPSCLRGICSRPTYKVSADNCSGFICFRDVSATSPSTPTSHPFGILPRADSSKQSGNRAATSGARPAGCSPRARAWTGSKSTNHDLNSACAMASSVALVSLSRAMRSSRLANSSAILFPDYP